eukprot:9172938-Pyramimonas_sp.AAC.1
MQSLSSGTAQQHEHNNRTPCKCIAHGIRDRLRATRAWCCFLPLPHRMSNAQGYQVTHVLQHCNCSSNGPRRAAQWH